VIQQSLALASAAALLLGACACASSARADLKAGDAAPAFELRGSDGKTYRLADYVGKRAVVLAWFPKAFTGG
jgi:peroxiredoxin Q/BCP